MAVYVTEQEFLDLGLPIEALSKLTTQQIEAALSYASRFADSYFVKRYPVPLVTYGEDVKRIIIDIAQYDLMAYRGFRPGSGADEIIVKRRDDALDWLKLVARKEVEPTSVTEATPEIAAPLSSSDNVVSWDFQTRSRKGNGGCNPCGRW